MTNPLTLPPLPMPTGFDNRYRCDMYSEAQMRAYATEAVRAAMEAQWRPIETAPKDGTHILIIDMTATTPEADRVFWGRAIGGEYWCCGEPKDWIEYPRAARELLGVYESPTHWMTLPPAPTAPETTR